MPLVLPQHLILSQELSFGSRDIAVLLVARLRESEVPGSIPGPAQPFMEIVHEIYGHFVPSTDSRMAVVNYWQKYGHLVLVSHLGGVSIPWNSMVRLTDCHRCLLWILSTTATTTS